MQEVVIKIKGDSSDIQKLGAELKALGNIDAKNQKQFEESNKKHQAEVKDTKDEYGKLNETIKNAKGAILAAFTVQAVMDFGKQVIAITSEFQKLKAVLGNTLGEEGGKKAFAEIQQFAAQTPFAVTELTGAFVKLANSGFRPTMTQMRAMGDLASAMGKDFDMLAEAVIDAQVGEFERLKEFGVRASKSGDQVSFTFKGVTKTVKNTSEEIQKYVVSLGDIQGVAGGMAKVSETLGGKISNLGDSWDRFLYAIGQSSSGIIGGTVETLGSLVSVMADLISPSEKVSENLSLQQSELNSLAVQLSDTNLKENERKVILERIKEINPDIVKGLENEKDANATLMKRLEDVNKQYMMKITLAKFDEEHKGDLEDLADAQIKYNDRLTSLNTILYKNITAQQAQSIAQKNNIKATDDEAIAKAYLRDLDKQIASGKAVMTKNQADLLAVTYNSTVAQNQQNKAQKIANDIQAERIRLQKMLQQQTGLVLETAPEECPPGFVKDANGNCIKKPVVTPPNTGTGKKPAELKEELTTLKALQKAYDDLAAAVDKNIQNGKVDKDLINKRDKAQRDFNVANKKYKETLEEINGTWRATSRDIKEIQIERLSDEEIYQSQVLEMEQNVAKERAKQEEKTLAEMRLARLNSFLNTTNDIVQIGNATVAAGQQITDALNLQGEQSKAAQKGFALANIAFSTASAIAKIVEGAATTSAQVAAASGPLAPITGPAAYAAFISQIATVLANVLQAKQIVMGYKDGTPSLQRNGNPAGVDTIPIMANEGEAIIPTDKNRQKPGLAAAWIKGNLDDYINVNYVIPALKRNKIDKDEAFASRIGKAISMSASFNDMNLLQSDKENRRILRSIDKTLKSGSMGLSRRKF